jgi:hypothetical protein
MHTWPLAILLAFFAKPSLSFSSKKTPFLKMYALCTNTAQVHILVAPLQPTYVCVLHHYSLRILAKVSKIKNLQGIR